MFWNASNFWIQFLFLKSGLAGDFLVWSSESGRGMADPPAAQQSALAGHTWWTETHKTITMGQNPPLLDQVTCKSFIKNYAQNEVS